MNFLIFSSLSFLFTLSIQVEGKVYGQLSLKLTNHIRQGDAVVVLGQFKEAPARISFHGRQSSICNRCQPLGLSFKPRMRRIEVYKTASMRKVSILTKKDPEVESSKNFELLIRVRSSFFEIKFNKQPLANVDFDSRMLKNIIQIRCYGAKFRHAYVLPKDFNRPAIYNPKGKNFWGNRINFLASRIIGGKEATAGEYPWQASLRLKQDRPWAPVKHLCGAVVISSCWVMSAAHCFNQIYNKKPSSSQYKYFLKENYIKVGDLFNGEDELDGQNFYEDEQDLDMERIYIHEDYRVEGNPIGDIALIRLEPKIGKECIRYSAFVQPINLPPPGSISIKPGKTCIISGWGALNWTDVTPPQEGSMLMWADVQMDDFEECQRNYSTNSAGVQKIRPGMFCASNPTKDTCRGDSGGPIFCPTTSKDEDHAILRGITSWGEGCAQPGRPGVYADVGLYMDWIINITEATANKSPPRHRFTVRSMVP